MKKILLFITAILISSIALASSSNYNRYEKPFIFVQNGIEFAVFNDGQFDFNIINSNHVNFNINTQNIDFSFNTGHNYNPFVQYDAYGAIIQIENTPVFYDNFGRVARIGATRMYYNRFGYASRIGNLYINYNNYGVYRGHRGAINSYQCTYSPRHNYYRLPPRNRCVVNTSPYRRNYIVHRSAYTSPRRPVAKTRYYNQRTGNVVHHYEANRNYIGAKKYTTPVRKNSYRKNYTDHSKRYVNRSATTPKQVQKHVNRSYNKKAIKKAYTPKRTYASNNNTNSRSYRRR